MKRGIPSPGGETSAEPNLTPMLDLVMNLLMFFMICSNFVNEQVNESVRLPDSESARPMDRPDSEALFVNVQPWRTKDFQGRLPPDVMARARQKFRPGDPVITIFGKEPMKLIELKFWLKDRFQEVKATAPNGEVQTAIVIRADKNTDYVEVFRILDQVKKTGFKKLRLRAIVQRGVDL